MEYKTLTWEVLPNPLRPEEKTIGVITLNRPDFLNAVALAAAAVVVGFGAADRGQGMS